MKMRDLETFKAPTGRRWLYVGVMVAVMAGVTALVVWGPRGRSPKGIDKTPGTAALTSAGTASTATGGVSQVQVPAVVTPEVTQVLSAAQAAEQGGNLQQARTLLLPLLAGGLPDRSRAEIETLLGSIHIRLALSPAPMVEKEDYIVKAGDSIDRIARKFATTMDLVVRGNEIKRPDLIKAGDRLRILKGTFAVVISKSRHDLLLTFNDQFFKRYAVGTGKHDKTPAGSFVVSDKQKEPVWWPRDGKEIPFGHPENILGTRWLAIRAMGDTLDVGGIGIHGTWDDASIGKSESAGCVRMHNADVEELYLFASAGMSVTIVE